MDGCKRTTSRNGQDKNSKCVCLEHALPFSTRAGACPSFVCGVRQDLKGLSPAFDSHTVSTILELICRQMLMQEQDRTLETISGTLNTLHQQAGLMGQEISEHNEYAIEFSSMIYSKHLGCWEIWRARSIAPRVGSPVHKRRWTTSYKRQKVCEICSLLSRL